MRALALAVLLLAAASPLGADEPRPRAAQIRALLASPTPLDAAWGLHHAVESRLPAADEAVRDVLRRWQVDATWAGGALRAAALDAAILLDVDLPEPLFRAVAPSVGAARVLLVAARSPAAYRDLLAPMLDAYMGDAAWTAVCSLLLPLRDPALTRHLLGRIRLHAQVVVRDPTPTAWHPVRSGAGFSVGTGCARIPPSEVKGWPPRHAWVFLRGADAGGRLVAPGREPIYAARRTLEEGGFACCRTSRTSRDRDAQAVLADLLGRDESGFRSSLSQHSDVAFTDLPALSEAVTAARDERKRAWLGILVACVFRGLLSAQEALSLAPHVDVDVRDARTVKEPPLPAGAGR